MITVTMLLACTISPQAWLAWIPEEVLTKAPYDTRVKFSNYCGTWMITNEAHELLWSSAPIEIHEDSGPAPVKSFKHLFAMLTPANLPEDNPQDIA